MTHDPHLSRIVTLWSVVRQAHEGPAEAVHSAQLQLLDRYGGAVRRYLLASLRDEDAADEVFQEFALRFVRGDFQCADPEQGRFRSFLKTVVYRLIIDYQRRRGRQARQQALPADGPAWSDEQPNLSDEQFAQSWRDELLARTWSALEAVDERERTLYHTVLRLRANRPELRSNELAEELASELDKPFTAGNVRVLVHRARERFADLLLEEVSISLESAGTDEIEQELIDLNLYGYCRDVLQRRRSDEP